MALLLLLKFKCGIRYFGNERQIRVGFDNTSSSSVRVLQQQRTHKWSSRSSSLTVVTASRLSSRQPCRIRKYYSSNANSNTYTSQYSTPISKRYGGLSYQSSSATIVGHHIFAFPTLYAPYRSTIQFSALSHDDDDEFDDSKILATSTVFDRTQLDIPTARRSFVQRLCDWLLRCWNNCQDVIFITIRTTEVLIRFSPLLLLAPASILYDQYLSYTDNDTTAPLSPSLLGNGNDMGIKSSTLTLNWVSDYTWMYVRSAITSLGPAFAKLGQWVATRRDIFPPHICDRLGILHDKGVTHDWKHTHTTLSNAFGSNYYELGLQLDEHSPIIGSGSAAQVYSVTLVRRINDEIIHYPVAVKVLHPRMTERVERDLQFVQTIAHWLHALPIERIKLLNLPRAVENFGNILLRQTDLQIEADNLNRFRDNFYQNSERNEKESAILFPKPWDGWVSRNVLVEDLASDAIPISEYLKDSTDHGIEIRRELASPLLRAFLKMIFIDNFVHCDLHAGNVLIQTYTVDQPSNKHSIIPSWLSSLFGSSKNTTSSTTNKDDNHPPTTTETRRKIVFLDAGIAMSLNPNDQRNLHDLFRSVLLNDGNRAGRLMVERAHYERCSQIPGGVDAFAAGIEHLVSEFHTRRQDGLTLGAVRIGSLLSRVLDLCRIYGVEIDPNMSSIVISTLVLEGLGRSLEPELNLIDFAIPFVLGRGRV